MAVGVAETNYWVSKLGSGKGGAQTQGKAPAQAGPGVPQEGEYKGGYPPDYSRSGAYTYNC